MLPNQKLIIDGREPSEGGEIEVEHIEPILPGQTISPSNVQNSDVKPPNNGLKPFSQQLQVDSNNISPPVSPSAPEPDINQNIANSQAIDLSDSELNLVSNTPIKEYKGQIIDNAGLDSQAPGADSGNLNTLVPSLSANTNNNQNTINAYNLNSQAQSSNQVSEVPNGMYSTNPNLVSTVNNVRPVYGGIDQQPTSPNINATKPQKNKKSKKIIFALMLIILVAVMAGFYFGYYLPNTPQNVWNTGLKRTGLQTNALVNKLSDKNAYGKTSLKITGNYEADGQKILLNIDSNLDNVSSDTKSSLQSDDGVVTLNLEALFKTQLPEGANLPNMYFKISGFKDLGLDYFLPGINNYDGQWIALEQDFYKSLNSTAEVGSSSVAEQVKYDDIISVIKDVNEVTNNYLFNPDTNNSILVLKQFVGAEQSEGITANHYKAGINTQNLTNWCNALVDKLGQNIELKNIYAIADVELNNALEQQKQECLNIDKQIKADEDFDIWFDKRAKIIHKIRVYEDKKAYLDEINEAKKQANYEECLANNNGQQGACVAILDQNIDSQHDLGTSYIEIGQVFKNRKQVKLFLNQVTQNNISNFNTRLDLNVNLDNFAFDGEINSINKSDDQESKLQIAIKTEPYSGQIDSTMPNGAVPLQQFFKEILGTDNPFAQAQNNAKDSKRQSDISSLYTGIEAYFVQNQTYPSYTQINDPQFRRQHLIGISEDYFSDPNAPNSQLASRVGANVYSYVTVPANCDGKNRPCAYYELSATMQDGSVYAKTAIQ